MLKISFLKDDVVVSSPQHIFDGLRQDYLEEKRECLGLICLDVKKKVVCEEVVSIGGLSECVAHPREIFRSAIVNSASSILLVHNHPSGDVSPSVEDLNIANKIYEVGKLIGISLTDFLIIGNSFKSFREDGLLDNSSYNPLWK